MLHSVFDAISGVTLEGSGGLTVQQLLETPGLIQGTVTVTGTPHTVTQTTPPSQCHLTTTLPITTISEGVSLDEDDVFQCGRCKKQFSSLDAFMVHKRDQCVGKQSSAIRVLPPPPAPPPPAPATEPSGFDAGDSAALTNPIHIQVHPSHTSQVSTGYGGSGLGSPGGMGQHIIVNEAELLPFTIETQVVPLGGGLQSATFLPHVTTVSSGGKSLPSAVSPLLTNTTVNTSLDVSTNLSPSQSLTTMVGGVGTVGEVEGTNVEGDKADVACYNHEFFHGGMAKTAPSKTDLHKLKTKHKCSYCQKEFSKNFDLQQHIRSHTGEKPFQCIVCGRAFTQKSNVKKHMATHKVWPIGSLSDTLPKQPIKKLMMTNAMIDMLDDGVLKEEVLVDDSYVCQFCSQSLSSYVELRSHMKRHSNQKVYKCIQKNCETTFEELDSFLDHIKTHDKDVQYRCHTCGKVFTALNDLGYHQHEHSLYPLPKKSIGPRYFRCTKCMNKYATPEALEHHLRTSSHHYPCQQCSKPFTSERHLRRHLHVHGTVNLFTCAQCSKEFKTEYSLKLHQLIHTGEKPFECNVCKAAFNRRDKLKRHLLIHEAKKHKCPFRTPLGCTREFSRADKLHLHIMTHAPGRARRGRGRMRGGTQRSDRVLKTEDDIELDITESSFCNKCNKEILHTEDHKCHILEEAATSTTVAITGGQNCNDTTSESVIGRQRPVRQAVVKRARTHSLIRRGVRRKRVVEPPSPLVDEGADIFQPKEEKTTPQHDLEPVLEVNLDSATSLDAHQGHSHHQGTEETLATIQHAAGEMTAEVAGCEVDSQNAEIIYITLPMPLTRPMSSEFMRAMSGDGGVGVDGEEALEGTSTITLEGPTSSLLDSNTVVPLLTNTDRMGGDNVGLEASLNKVTEGHASMEVIYDPTGDHQLSHTQLTHTELSDTHLSDPHITSHHHHELNSSTNNPTNQLTDVTNMGGSPCTTISAVTTITGTSITEAQISSANLSPLAILPDHNPE